jgi:hypothetical protein
VSRAFRIRPIALTALLVLALVLHATVSGSLGAYASLGLVLAAVMVGLPVQFRGLVSDDDRDIG